MFKLLFLNEIAWNKIIIIIIIIAYPLALFNYFTEMAYILNSIFSCIVR